MRLPFSSDAYKEVAPGTPSRQMLNLFPERVETDSQRPIKLVKIHGSLALPDWIENARGYDQADGFAGGKILVVVGNRLKTYDPLSGIVGTIAGTIGGSDRVQIVFTATECGILGGGVIHVTDGATVAATTDPDFPAGITSIWSIEQRVLFSYGTAGRWGYTELLNIDNTTALSYYTAEYSSDGLIGGFVIGSTSNLHGQKTLERWIPTGVDDNPYRRITEDVRETGTRCRDSIRKLDSKAYWIDQESNVRRDSSAPIPQVISTPVIARAIRETATDDIICFSYERDGHAFYGVWLPTACYVFDANSPTSNGAGSWGERRSGVDDTWRYAWVVSAAGNHYAGDAQGVGFAKMGREFYSEHMPDANTMGTEIRWIFTAYGPITSGEPLEIYSVRLEGAKGQGLPEGQGSQPVVQLRKWLGERWSNWRSRGLGALGRYALRVIWTGLGLARAPGLWLEIAGSDPVLNYFDGVVVNED